ncbi:hypothetical protein BDD12DRAFT_879909 [Trichophaea hybrida]|nr:hypothetical protein BDD12DRAFT_879909 [Trichophaea hybrida]
MPPQKRIPATATSQQQRMQAMCRAVLECQITEPKIDFTRFAQRMGYKNERVAQDSYHRFRAMLRGDKNYGNRKGRTAEKFRKKLRDLGKGSDAPARYSESEEEGTGHGFNFSRGEESGGNSATVTSGAIATPGGERRGFFFTGETVVLDPDEPETREEKENEEKEKEKEKEKEVKLEIKNEPEVWEWEGAAGFKGYI